jgi:predicted metal-dependent enzyme (double-stranded beta helix superfamily)
VLDRPYRFYHLLSNLEDLLECCPVDEDLLEKAVPLLYRLLASSPWFSLAVLPPDLEVKWSVQNLDDEPDLPLTVQLVSWASGRTAPIHNHGCWGLVNLLLGLKRSHVWGKRPGAEGLKQILPIEGLCLQPGDTLLLPEAIHSVEALGEEQTVSINRYGPTDYTQRFELNPQQGTAQLLRGNWWN